MIAVIADDFTGAAEIGGVGLRHGLKVVIETKVHSEVNADLLVIAADTRNLDARSARKEIEKITELLMLRNPEYIYKKIDSVFRGNVGEELEAQMKVSNKNRCVIIAGNPFLNRYIKDGIYYIQNIPLSETHFSNDKEYKIQSSSVTDFVQTDREKVYSKNVTEEIPENGIVIGDVRSIEDFISWQLKLDGNTAVAGGAGYFDILLSKKYNKLDKNNEDYEVGDKALFIFGSAFPKHQHFFDLLDTDAFYISNMPDLLYWNNECDESLILQWSNQIISQLNTGKKVVVTINHSGNEDEDLPARLKERIGKVVFHVVQKVNLKDILIEGGATASVIFRYLKITRLFPFQEIDPGVIQMTTPDYPNLFITTKPGSYQWPDQMLMKKNL